MTAARANRPRIPLDLARQIERLARRAHAFHRFAHHPLCDRYAGELIRVGRRRRICRGCAFVLAGAIVGTAVAALVPESVLNATLAGLVAALSAVSAAMSVSRQPLFPRGKLYTRALPSFGFGFAIFSCARLCDARALALLFGIFAVAFLLQARYRARGPDRSPCRDCKERSQAVPCSGFRDIVRAERAFVRRSRVYLDRAYARRAAAERMTSVR